MSEHEFNSAVGRQLRSARVSAELRQGDIAEAARCVGLSWGRSSVAALETGARGLSAFEWLLLPRIYGAGVLECLGNVKVSPEPALAGPDEADRKIAAKLGLSAQEVRRRASALWGPSVAAERDARARTPGGSGRCAPRRAT